MLCVGGNDRWDKIMDFFAILEQYGIPVVVAIAFGYFIWKQNQFIQKELMEELDQDFKRLEMIIIKLIDQQKKIQIEMRGIVRSYQSLVEIVTKLIKKG
jgi:hypothetical protein